MNQYQTPREIASIYRIAELRVFEATIRYGLKYTISRENKRVVIAKADFHDFAQRNQELIKHWQKRMSNPDVLTPYRFEDAILDKCLTA